MNELAPVLEALAALAWPLLLGLLLFRLRHILPGLLESAKSRRFTIKLAGSELTMEEATEQQRLLISDLQEKLVALEEGFQALSEPGQATEGGPPPDPDVDMPGPPPMEGRAREVRSILWVDDNPRNNASLIGYLGDLGIRVVTALSTAEGMKRVGSEAFDRIITDLGRKEDGEYRGDAGIELIQEIREVDPDVPILVYTSSGGARHRGPQARAAGASVVTASPTSLLRGLDLRSGKMERP